MIVIVIVILIVRVTEMAMVMSIMPYHACDSIAVQCRHQENELSVFGNGAATAAAAADHDGVDDHASSAASSDSDGMGCT